jgi:polysaccharide deacetylase family protein (PEP-CTERM system associated)
VEVIHNALSFDVEDYFQVAALSKSVPRDSWDGRTRRVDANTRTLLDILAETGTRATFYILGWVADREPRLVKAIADAGHEIACHGYSHQLVYRQTESTFREETCRARKILEDLAQVPVTSYRAASYSIIDASLWALDVLYEEGFRTDSSIFPIRHDTYGLTGGPLIPHHLDLPCGGRLLEFPISTTRVLGMNLPVSGGGYFRLYPYSVSRALARRVNSESRPFMFYLHPWEVDPDQPRVNASLLSRFRHYNNLAKTRPRLEHLLADFRFTTVSDCIAVNYDDNDLPVHSYRR